MTKFQWELRQWALSVLLLPISISGVIIGLIAIRSSKFIQFGLAAIPNHAWPKVVSIPYVLQEFWRLELLPLMPWLLLAVPADLAIRRIFYKLKSA